MAMDHFEFRERAPGLKSSAATQMQRSAATLMFIFILMTAGIVTGSYLSYHSYERQYHAQVENQLAGIAALKADELQDWRNEREGDAKILYDNPVFSMLVQRTLENPDDDAAQVELQAWLNQYHIHGQYNRIFLLDTNGVERLSAPATPEPVAAYLAQAVGAVLDSGQITFVDFHRDGEDSPVYLALLTPVFTVQDHRPLGMLVMRIDPTTYLYPYLQQWPVPSASAETALLRREGDTVLFLNELKFQADAALNLRLSLQEAEQPAVQAALGYEGIVEGINYRGVPVIAAVRAVPDSPWFLAARVDAAEMHAPLRERLWQTLLFFGILLFASGAGLGLIWRQQRIRYYQGQVAAAEALAATQKLLQDVTDNSESLIYALDVDGKFLLINRRLESVLGAPRETLIGKTRAAILPAEMAAFHRANDLQVIEGKRPITIEEENVEPDGKHTYLSVKFPLADAKGNLYGVGGISTDITARKRSEESLTRTERLYRQAITQAGGVPYQTEYRSDRYTFLGEGIENLTGYTAEELTGSLFTGRLRQSESFGEHTALPHAERVRLARQGIILQWREDYLFERRDGGLVWLADHSVPVYDDAGNITGALGILLDITARKQAERALHDALETANQSRRALLSMIEDQKQAEETLATERALLRTLVDHLPDAVYVKDTASRKTLSNPVDLRNIGVASEAEVLGKTDFDLFPPDLAEKYHADDQYVIQTGQPILNREEGITRPDGTRGWQLTSKVPVRDSDGEVIGLVGIGHDITERKQAAELLRLYTEQLEALVAERTRALEEAQERLLRQERLTVLGQIAGGIAHELRTPLGAIMNSIYLLTMLIESPDATVAEALGIMRQEIGVSDRIISSLLNFTRPQRPARQSADLHQVIEQALARVDVPPEIEVRRLMDGELPHALVDAGQVEQVFGNLILNAAQAMPQGGRLTIQTGRVRTLPENVETGFVPTDEGQDGGWIVVSVSDSGTGISPEHLADLFQPLFTTKVRGMGLGLSLVKLLTEANGGGIAVESTPGQGATFHSYWPVFTQDENLTLTNRR